MVCNVGAYSSLILERQVSRFLSKLNSPSAKNRTEYKSLSDMVDSQVSWVCRPRVAFDEDELD